MRLRILKKNRSFELSACCFSQALFVVFLLTPVVVTHAQQPRLGLDANGDITLGSGDGHRTVLAGRDHCNEVMGTPDGRLLACFVSHGVDDHGFRPQFEIEIYHEDGQKLILQPGGAIRDWRFWNDYQQLAICFTASNRKLADALYDVETGKVEERIEEPADPSQLPQWAKRQSQIDDESVPTDPESLEAQNAWLAKTLRQIGDIRPGMHRRDLDSLFRHDGGVQFGPGEDRYVFKRCPIIKIDVGFVVTDESRDPFQEDPDDVIKSVSKPYLQWATMD